MPLRQPGQLSRLRKIAIALCIAGCLLSADAAEKKTGVMLAPKTVKEKQAADLLVEGNRLLKLKKPVQARPLIEKAAAMWPESAHVHYNLACCYEEMGNFQKAISEYEATLKIDPSMTDCIPNIASCYQLLNRPQDAINLFENYLKKRPNATDAEEIKGMVAALKRQSRVQIDSDPQSGDYLQSLMPKGCPQRWQRTRLPLKVFFANGRNEQGQPVRGFQESYNLILLDAFNTWMKASENRLAYVVCTDPFKADIVCSWTDRKDFLSDGGSKVEQGVAKVASLLRPGANEEEIGHVRVIILVLDMKGVNSISDQEMKKACLHEVGHALGLAGHSSNNRDIMFFSDSPTVWASLTKRDKATIAKLYGDYPQIQVLTQDNAQVQRLPAAPNMVQQQNGRF